MLDSDLEKHHAEEKLVPAAINKMGDAMPGFGIVAAESAATAPTATATGPSTDTQ